MDLSVAARPLELTLNTEGVMRLSVGDEDWFGPLSLAIGGETQALSQAGVERGQDSFGAFTRQVLSHGAEADIAASVETYDDQRMVVFTLTAQRDLPFGSGIGLEALRVSFPRADVDARADLDIAKKTLVFGYQLTEFAMPVFSAGSFRL